MTYEKYSEILLGDCYRLIEGKEKEVIDFILSDESPPLEEWIEYQKHCIEVTKAIIKLEKMGFLHPEGARLTKRNLQGLYRGLKWLESLRR